MIVVGSDGTVLDDSYNLSDIILPRGIADLGKVKITYDDEGVRVDGPFTVEFGDVKLIYSTIDT